MDYDDSIVCVFFLAASNLLGQKPAFEVASVKPNNSGNDSSSSKTSQRPHGSMTDINVTLRFLILAAYELREFQVAGGPACAVELQGRSKLIRAASMSFGNLATLDPGTHF